MLSTCPNCDRSLPVDDSAAFCMYCGAELGGMQKRDQAPSNESAAGSMPVFDVEPASDPHATMDYRTITSESELGQEDPVPERVGIFRLIRRLGIGGMGQVFEAESDENGERVALKLLSPKLITNPNSVERFKQEGRLASQITHPRCVFVYGADTEEGRPYIVMELMPGSTLKDLVDQIGPLPWDQAIHRIIDVIDGLIEAHRLGMLHRDVKPSNCFLTQDDRVKIGDFGLSKSLDNQQVQKQLTSSGAFLGTVLFASPEQIRGEEVSYDSDVYSVAATFYFLLVGRAPHQHISMTAALAKVISEPPPSIRSFQPDVPKALEKIVFRGLDRDRNRRFASLEELRDALQDLLPERQLPARIRSLISAYVLDALFCLFALALPISLIGEAMFGSSRVNDFLNSNILYGLILILYFTLSEGVYGASLGKLPFRLRTVRLGRVGPIGLVVALIRSSVFHGSIGLILVLTGLISRIPVVGPLCALGFFVLAALILFISRGRSPTQQGFHDLASRCRVVQRPRAEHRPRLISPYTNPLNTARQRHDLPAQVSGFRILGILTQDPNGSMVWVAEDEALNRRILLWLRPANQLPKGVPQPPVRPGRLRAISTGEWLGRDKVYGWTAFVAPTGTSLVDLTSPEHQMEWADTRSLLEQVVIELRASSRDGSMPARLGVDQLWVEPNGRVHLLDFPIPPQRCPVEAAETPIELIRQVARTSLQGEPTVKTNRIIAPIPPHATRICSRIFAEPAVDLGELENQLIASRANPPAVSSVMRAAHLGLIAAISGWAVLILIIVSVGFTLLLTTNIASNRSRSAMIREGLSSPRQVEIWRSQSPLLQSGLDGTKLTEWQVSFQQFQEEDEAELDQAMRTLSRLERSIVLLLLDLEESSEELLGSPVMTGFLETQVANPQYRVKLLTLESELRTHDAALRSSVINLVFVLGLSLFAGFFRGGVSYLLSGIALVRADGQPAERWRCALRELIIWSPFLFLNLMNIWIQSFHPEWIRVRSAFGVLTLIMIFAYFVIGLRYPSQGPHDRLVGTHMVPA